MLYQLRVQSLPSTLWSVCVILDLQSSPSLVLEWNSDLPFWSVLGSLYFWHHVIVLRIMKLLFGTFQINLYYVKLSPKQRTHVTSMQTFLILSWMVRLLTTVTDRSNLHKGGTIHLKATNKWRVSHSNIYSGCWLLIAIHRDTLDFNQQMGKGECWLVCEICTCRRQWQPYHCRS